MARKRTRTNASYKTEKAQAGGQPVAVSDAMRTIKRFENAARKKHPWESVFEDCYAYAMPGKESPFQQAPGQSRTDKIFDETAVVGVQEFASRLQAGIVPNWSRWADLVGGPDVDKGELEEVNLKLNEVTETVFNVLAASNFASEVAESFLDLAVGTGCLDIDEGDDALHPVRFTAIPLAQLYIDVGPDDSVDFISRPKKVRVSQLRHKYPRAKLTENLLKKYEDAEKDHEKDCDVDLIEALYRDWSEAEETWIFCVVSKEDKEELWRDESKGLGSARMIVFRWSKLAGEVWGRGPLLNALPAIKTCNLTVEMILENAEMAIAGMYTIEDDGVANVDTIELLPGTLIPIAPGSKMTPLAAAGSFDVAQLVLNDMRANIKRALYNDMLGNPDKTPMSATEVSTRMADLSRQIGSAFGRLQYEFVEPLLRRVIAILKRMGLITIPPIDGKVVKIAIKSPLAQAQAHQDVETIAGYVQSIGALFGPQMVNVLIKSEEASAVMARKLMIPGEILRNEQERKMILNMAQSALTASQGGGAPPEGAPPGGPSPSPVGP